MLAAPWLLAIAFPLSGRAAPPVIPGAAGFGMTTPAGRGGEVIRVTNLDDAGPGSLRAAIETSGPRVIVFEVSGTIRTSRNFYVRHPFVTIAGQTAPSPGITIGGGGLFILTHDVLAQHLRIRPGDDPDGPNPENRDAMAIGTQPNERTFNVVVDHVSCSWGTDEVFSVWGGPGALVKDVTISHSLISEPLASPLHPEGPHPFGLIIGRNSERIAVVGNIMAYCPGRNPLVRDDVTDVVILNNLVHMPGQWTTSKISLGSRGDRDLPFRVSVVGNAYNPVPNAHNANFIGISGDAATDTKVYLADNLAPNSRDDPWAGDLVTVQKRDVASVKSETPPIWHESFRPIPARDVEKHLLAFAGARPADRDAVDARVIRLIRERAPQDHVATVAAAGGYPALAENRRPLDLPDNPHGDDDGNGYTNLEEWLHAHAAAVEGREPAAAQGGRGRPGRVVFSPPPR